MTVESLISYLLFVIPGFVSIEVYRSKYPVKSDTDFGRLGWAIVNSLVIVAIVKYFDPSFSFDPSLTPTPTAIVELLICAVSVGLVRIGFRYTTFQIASWKNSLRFLYPDPQSIWPLVNNERPAEWAVVIMNDSSRYLGWIQYWSFDPNSTVHDFLLQDASCVDDQFNIRYKVEGRGLYVSNGSVARIEYWSGPQHQKMSSSVN